MYTGSGDEYFKLYYITKSHDSIAVDGIQVGSVDSYSGDLLHKKVY